MTVAQRAFAARLEADARSADSRSAIAGGEWLRTPSLPDIWDLNVAMLGPQATDADVAAAAALDVRRITLFRSYDGPQPAGFETAERSLLMTFDAAEPPPMPGGVTEVERPIVRYADDHPDQIAAMHDRQVAAGARTFVVGEHASAVLANGCVDDVFVVESERGKGLGRTVTTAALAAGGWFLWCDEDDPGPQALYRSLGMTAAGGVAQFTRPG